MEHIKNIIAWELLFILVFASLLVIDAADGGFSAITGKAIEGVTEDTVLQDLEAVIPQLDFMQDIGDVSFCLIVTIDAATKYSYEILKIGDAVAITNSQNLLCKGTEQEDFIVSYISYAKLREHLDTTPAFEDLKRTGDGTNFYLYPSKQVLPGAYAADPKEFNERFGTILNKYFTSAERKALLNPPKATTEREASFASYIFYFILGLVVLVVIIGAVIFSHTKKPEVKEDLEIVAYIKSALSQGYAQEQVYQSLIQSGWSAEQIQEAFRSIQTQGTGPQVPANP